VFCADSIATTLLLNSVASKPLTLAEPVLHALSVAFFLKGFHLSLSEMLHLLSFVKEDRSELKGFREHKNPLVTLLQALESGSFVPELGPFLEASTLRKGAQEFFQNQVHTLSIEKRMPSTIACCTCTATV
jgi:hypothetical protein